MNRILWLNFICSPNMGSLDNWLPIICYIKEKNLNVRMRLFLPKSSQVELIDNESPLTEILSNITNEIYFKNSKNNWEKSELKLIDLLTSLPKKQNSGTYKNSLFARFINFFLRTARKNKTDPEELDKLKSLVGATENFSEDIVFFDILESQKDYLTALLQIFATSPKYSQLHGVNIQRESEANGVHLNGNILETTKCFLFSQSQSSYYTKIGVPKKNQLVVGLSRHTDYWYKKIIDTDTFHEPTKDKVAFLASRPDSEYLPYKIKKSFLIKLRDQLIRKSNFFLAIKLHPKESNKTIFYEALGRENQGKTWDFFNNHPFTLGNRSSLSFTFFSSVCIDMAFLRKPNIELLNLQGIPRYDNKDSIRNKNGEPVLNFRELELTLGASTGYQIENIIKELSNTRYKCPEHLIQNYKKYFYSSDKTLKKVYEIITETL